MVRPRPGGTTLLIVVSPVPGKYELVAEKNFATGRRWVGMLESVESCKSAPPVST